MDSNIQRRREDRQRFLRRLYELSEESTEVYADGYTIADEMGLSRQDAERIVRYHEDHGFVKNTTGTGLAVRITAHGIDYIESLLAP